MAKRSARRTAPEREELVLDAAAELFYARGVHEVGVDELVAASGLGKASVYRTFASKDELIGAYLRRLAVRILELIDADIAARPDDPGGALAAIFAAISEDVGRPEFRGCPFNNASIEFASPAHPARAAARDYRAALRERLGQLSRQIDPERGGALADRLALVVDGMYTSGAHLGADGPAAAGPEMATALIEAAKKR